VHLFKIPDASRYLIQIDGLQQRHTGCSTRIHIMPQETIPERMKSPRGHRNFFFGLEVQYWQDERVIPYMVSTRLALHHGLYLLD
jgi:hypothetical protein